jgi:hypothetical protein
MLGVAMGASGDHSLFPVYAHIKSVRAMRYDHFARRHESLPLQSQFATQNYLTNSCPRGPTFLAMESAACA